VNKKNLLIIGGVLVAGYFLLFSSKGENEGDKKESIMSQITRGFSSGNVGGGIINTESIPVDSGVNDNRVFNYNIDLSMPENIWGESGSASIQGISEVSEPIVTQSVKRRNNRENEVIKGQVVDFNRQVTDASRSVNVFDVTTASSPVRFAQIPDDTGWVLDRHQQMSIPFSTAEQINKIRPRNLFQERLNITPNLLTQRIFRGAL